jgi:uncharacterized membrane protein YtjA (UPF0391 family)
LFVAATEAYFQSRSPAIQDDPRGRWNPAEHIRVLRLIIALIAAVLGFGGIAGLSIEIAKIIFVVAIILFVISAIFGLMRGRSPTLP